jgi:ComF family protein
MQALPAGSVPPPFHGNSRTSAQLPEKSAALFKGTGYGIYEGVLADAIHHFRFHKIKRLTRPLGRFLLTIDLSDIDALVPVPLSAGRLRERGFNQSLLLAQVVSRKAGIPTIINGLLKKKDTLPQIGLSAAGRTTNIRGAFSAVGSYGGLLLMLIVDVMTTGAAARECKMELLKAGAASVTVAALARHQPYEKISSPPRCRRSRVLFIQSLPALHFSLPYGIFLG